MDQLRIGREHHVLRLHGGIDNHPAGILRLHRPGLDRDRQAFLQQRAQPLLAHAAPPARHRRAVEGQVVAEELFAAEILEIGVLHPAGAQLLVRQVEGMFEDRQPRHQPRWQRRHAGVVGIDRAEAPLQKWPVDRLRQPHQLVSHVDDLIQPGAEQVLLSRLAPLAWSRHRRSSIHRR